LGRHERRRRRAHARREGVTVVAGTGGAISSENAFVAGEIDVPTPTPEGKPSQVEFTAASKLLGNTEPSDPDTGSRTPPLERRSGGSSS
jgi:hypothetical protein